MASFKHFIEINKQEIDFSNIGNMDEVSVSFDMVGNYTIVKKGIQDVKISTTGHQKSNFTVILCVTADGGKCLPLVIFKRKTIPNEIFPIGIVVKVNEKGWINQKIIKEWLDEVWRIRKNAFCINKEKSILIWDSATTHIAKETIKEASKYSKLAVIPGGLTKLLQPLDLTVNRSFKSKLKEKWEEWMSKLAIHIPKKESGKEQAIVKFVNG